MKSENSIQHLSFHSGLKGNNFSFSNAEFLEWILTKAVFQRFNVVTFCKNDAAISGDSPS